MKTYRDSLGFTYEVSKENVEEFERRRGVLLKVAIVVKLVMLVGILYLAFR